MQALLFVMGGAALSFWALWWMTFRALREAQCAMAEKQSCIDNQLDIIEQLVESHPGTYPDMPERMLRRRARDEVRTFLHRQLED